MSKYDRLHHTRDKAYSPSQDYSELRIDPAPSRPPPNTSPKTPAGFTDAQWARHGQYMEWYYMPHDKAERLARMEDQVEAKRLAVEHRANLRVPYGAGLLWAWMQDTQ